MYFFLEFYSDNILLHVSNRQAIHLQEAILLYMQFKVCSVKVAPEDEKLAYSKHVEDVIRIKFKKKYISLVLLYNNAI